MIRTGMLTNAQIKELIEDYITYSLERTDQSRVHSGAIHMMKYQNTHMPETVVFDPEQDKVIEDLEAGSYDYVARQLDEFLSEINLDIDKDSAQYKQLCRDVSLAHLDKIHEINVQRDSGDYSDKYYLREWKPEAKQKTQEDSPVDEPQGLLLSKVIDKYIKENNAQNKWKDKTRDRNTARLKLVLELIGDKPAKSVTRDDVIDCLDNLQKIPPNRTKRFPDKSAPELLAMNLEFKPFGVKTVRDHMTLFSTVLKWAVRLGYVDRNVAEGVAPRDTRSADEQRSVYSQDNLQKMYDFFSPAPYKVGKRIITEEDKWIVLLGMYSGARMDEICRLYKEDISQIDGVWTISLVEREGKKTKTVSGVRKVPIHPQLLELGFLEYYAKIEHERLFPSLKKGRDGYSASFQKKFSHINRQYITEDKTQVFHSLRHNFTNGLKQAGVQEQQIGELVGHKSGSITMERYGKKYEPKVLLEVIKKLDYGLTY